MSGTSLALLMIEAVEWSTYDVMDGAATALGSQLHEFLTVDDIERRSDLWRTMENNLFCQDDIFSAAEPAIPVLLASLTEPATAAVRIAVLDLLFHLVQGARFRGDQLGDDCLKQACMGSWEL
jgi:hypothetical protein